MTHRKHDSKAQRALPLLWLVALLVVGRASAADDADAAQAPWRPLAAALEQRGDPDALTAAALIHMQLDPTDARVAELLDRALVAAAEAPELVWLRLRHCLHATGCDPRPWILRLEKLDPTNATSYSVLLGLARQQKSVAQEDAALAAMSAAERFDMYWSALILRTTRALAGAATPGVPPLRRADLALVETIGWLVANAMPSLVGVSDTCRGPRLDRDDVRRNCAELARVLDRGDTNLAAAIGREIAYRVWPKGAAERAHFEAEYRRYRYVTERVSEFFPNGRDDEDDAREYLALLTDHRREQDTAIAWLAQRGIASTLPTDEPSADARRSGLGDEPPQTTLRPTPVTETAQWLLPIATRARDRPCHAPANHQGRTNPMPQLDAQRSSPLDEWWPPEALAQRKSGTAGLWVTVSSDGCAMRVELVQSSGSAILDDAAMRYALEGLRYFPAMRDGAPIEDKARTNVRFWAPE